MRAAHNQPQNRLIWPSSGAGRSVHLQMPAGSNLARRQTDDLQGQSAASMTALSLHCSCSLLNQRWVPLGFSPQHALGQTLRDQLSGCHVMMQQLLAEISDLCSTHEQGVKHRTFFIELPCKLKQNVTTWACLSITKRPGRSAARQVSWDTNFIPNTKRTAAKLPFLMGWASVFAMPEDKLPSLWCWGSHPIAQHGYNRTSRQDFGLQLRTS